MDMRTLMEVVRINLTEALDRPSAIEWKKDELGWRGDFQTPSGRWFTILISRLKNEGAWAFEFSETPQHVLWLSGRAEKPAPILTPNPVGTRRPTGRGEQFSVYSTVIEAMRQFIASERPRSVRFKGAVGKQTTLYQIMMGRHADEIRNMGYRQKGAALVATQDRLRETYDDEIPHQGSFGWWIFADGSVEEMGDMGMHGATAHAHLNLSDEETYDDAITRAIDGGAIRVATFHGTDEMNIDYDPGKATPVAIRSLMSLMRDTRHEFSRYWFEAGSSKPKALTYAEAMRVLRARPITEAVVEQVGNPPYPVLINPSSNSLSRFISNTSHKLAKGLFDPTSNTAFFWDAYKATHAMAETDLGLDDPVAIIVGFNDDGKIALDVMAHDERPKALNHPALKGINNDPDDSFMRRWQ